MKTKNVNMQIYPRGDVVIIAVQIGDKEYQIDKQYLIEYLLRQIEEKGYTAKMEPYHFMARLRINE